MGTVNGEQLSEILRINIRKVHATGFRIVAISGDQGSNNRKAYRLLGASKEKPYVDFEGARIFLLYDVPHLMKSVRNTLYNKDRVKNHCNIQTGDDIVSWKIIETVYNCEKDNTFRVLFKLTPKHVYPNSFDKLSVKLATQIFSHNVASVVYAAIAEGYFKTDAEIKIAKSTAKFLAEMNNLFDHLNCSTINSDNPNKQPIADDNDILDKIKESCEWIQSWVSTGRMKRPYCFDGFIQTITGKNSY